MSEPLPKLDLSILGAQLDNLYQKGLEAAAAHNNYLIERKVPRSYSTSWYQDTMYDHEMNGLSADEGSVTWYGSDSDRDSLYMTVPHDVLDGIETPEQWAERTYTRYLKSEEDRKQREHEKWLATKDRRREQFERLKAEFDGEETPPTAG